MVIGPIYAVSPIVQRYIKCNQTTTALSYVYMWPSFCRHMWNDDVRR